MAKDAITLYCQVNCCGTYKVRLCYICFITITHARRLWIFYVVFPQAPLEVLVLWVSLALLGLKVFLEILVLPLLTLDNPELKVGCEKKKNEHE